MTTTTLKVEHRMDARADLSWPVSVWLPEANRFINGRSVNVSKGGVYMSVPMTTPIKDGSEIEINFPRTKALAEQKGRFARIKSGKVIRVDRNHLIDRGLIKIAIQFVD